MPTTDSLPEYNDLIDAYEKNPTIANYVKLRRAYPAKPIAVGYLNNLDELDEINSALIDLDLTPELVDGVLQAEAWAISEFSLFLLERLIARERAGKAGESQLVSRGKAISDRDVNFLIGAILDSLAFNGALGLSQDLLFLIRHQLGADRKWEDIKKREELRIRIDEVIRATLDIVARGEPPSYRAIARELGVNVTTITRSLPNDLLDQIQGISKAFKRVKKAQQRSQK
jgi:hypothetical protein